MLLVSSIAYALNETTVNVKGKVRETIKLELPDPARGYIDYSKWTCDNSNIEFMYKSTGYAQIRIERYFEGVAEIECAYTAKWYDNRGWTNSDSYLRTFYVSCEPDNSELTVKISPSNEQLRIGTQIKLESNNSNASIYYTMDDTSPLEKNTSITANFISQNR